MQKKNGFTYHRVAKDEQTGIEYAEDLAYFFTRNVTKPFPKPNVLANYTRAEPTLNNIESQIEALNREHGKHLEQLYQHQAREVKDLRVKHFIQYIGPRPRKPNDIIPSNIHYPEELEKFYAAERRDMLLTHEDTVARFRYAHQKKLLELQQKRVHLIKVKQQTQELRNRTLPRTLAAFEEMEFSHKVKVARYLTSNDQERATFEGNQSLWTEDDAIALFEEYSGNDAFQDAVRNLLESTQSKDPRKRVANANVNDPRRRASLSGPS